MKWGHHKQQNKTTSKKKHIKRKEKDRLIKEARESLEDSRQKMIEAKKMAYAHSGNMKLQSEYLKADRKLTSDIDLAGRSTSVEKGSKIVGDILGTSGALLVTAYLFNRRSK